MLTKKILNLLMPHTCVVCNFRSLCSRDLCDICYAELPWLTDRCYQCGLPLQLGLESIRCSACSENRPPYSRFCGLFEYQPPITSWITKLKFGHKLNYGALLGQLLLEQLPQWYCNNSLPEVVIPMPLHYKRLWQRGFNQIHEILRPLQQSRKINIEFNLCQRIKDTKPQLKGGRGYRNQNLRGAFALGKPIKYHHIAIIDDVMTTGSTMRAISELFFKANVSEIDLWCIARA